MWCSPFYRVFLVGAILLMAATAGCRVTDIPLWGPAHSPCACEVQTIKGISYRTGDDADARRHSLDVFVPKGKKNCPVVVLVHGGAWMMGDNRCCGLYSSVGEYFAGQGMVTVMPNYRLSPFVKHPAHIRDVACAMVWVDANIGKYGGRRDQIFLVGHSAGGHLVSLLATDEKYLKAQGLDTKNIKGVIAVSGVYEIPPGSVDVTLGGQAPNAFRWDKMAPLRQAGSPSDLALPGIPCSMNIFGIAFGNDPKVRQAASPINHIRPGLPPFLLFTAENDLPLLPDMAKDFHQALLRQKCQAELLFVEQRNHNSIMFGAYRDDDPVAREMTAFIRRQLDCEHVKRRIGSPRGR